MAATIRLATIADGPDLAAIYAPAVAGRATSFELEAPDGVEMGARVERLMARTPWLVCAHGGSVVGYAYASPHRDRAACQWSGEVSPHVRDSVRRAGLRHRPYT